MFATFLLTGFREQEVMFLYWSDVNFDLRTVRVTSKPGLGFYPKRWEDRKIFRIGNFAVCWRRLNGGAIVMNQTTDRSLRQLRYFAALAEELHFGKAASRLGISQPPLTRQIQALEKFVGTPLLERTQRSVSLTAAGVAFAGELESHWTTTTAQ